MKYKVTNPKEDMNGNKKENIFIAKDENRKYIAHSYVWPYENYHSSYAKPRNIYIEVEMPKTADADYDEIRQKLFDSALRRAYEIKNAEWKSRTVRIYGGALAYDKDKINFFIKQGFFDDDAALIMKNDLKNIAMPNINEKQWVIKINQLETEIDKFAFIGRHNSIFPNEINLEKIDHLMKHPGWKLYGIRKDQELVGECMVFDKSGTGYIELFYVSSEFRGKGASGALMDYVLKQLQLDGYNEASLGVWQRNERAIKFYERHGFRQTGEREEVFPGIDV